MSEKPKVVYSSGRLAARIAQMGREVSRDYAGSTVDAVIILEDAFVFAADLLRRVTRPVVCHFVRSETRDVELSGFSRREVFFTKAPALRGRDILIVASVLHTGITLDFLCKRLMESHPRSLRLAVLVDKPGDRRVDLQPDYFGFVGASNQLIGYGLAGRQEQYRNLPYVGSLVNRASAKGASGKTRRKSGTARPRRVNS